MEYFHSWTKGQSKPQNHEIARRVSHSDGTIVSPRPDPADSSFMAVYNQRLSTGFDKNTSVVRSNSEEVSEGTLGYIRSQIIDGLPSSHGAHRKILLSVHSDIVGFMTDQFGETINPDTTLGSVITLSGSALYAQAMTCESYVQFHWGLQSLGILKLLQDAMNNPSQSIKGTHTKQFYAITPF